jgi:hypothetical protein
MISSIQVTFDATTDEIEVIVASADDASTKWFVAITGPDGVVTSIELGTADLTAASGTLTYAYPFGSLAAGEYSFTVLQYPDGSSVGSESLTQTLDYQPSIGMTYSVSHDGEYITVTDQTVYPLTTLSSFVRSTSLSRPTVAGVPTLASVVNTSASFRTSMALADGKIWEFVSWNASGTSGYTNTITTGKWTFIYDVAGSGSASLEVIIALDPCGVISCVDELWSELYSEACSRGGFDKLTPIKQSQLVNLLGNLQMYRYWIQCGNITKAKSYYDIIAGLVGSGCTLDTSPSPAYTGNPAISGEWTIIPSDDYESGYVYNASSPLSWRVYNGLLQFKGVIGMDTFSQAGTTMVAAAYWATNGVVATKEAYVPVVDAFASNLGGEGTAHFDSDGDLVIKGNAAIVTTGHDFAIGGMIPTEL